LGQSRIENRKYKIGRLENINLKAAECLFI
jgi:hypothetical protein